MGGGVDSVQLWGGDNDDEKEEEREHFNFCALVIMHKIFDKPTIGSVSHHTRCAAISHKLCYISQEYANLALKKAYFISKGFKWYDIILAPIHQTTCLWMEVRDWAQSLSRCWPLYRVLHA